MKAVGFKEVGKVDLVDLPDPEVTAPEDAIVKVSMAGLCGSDLHPFFGRELGLDVDTPMGHEFVGEIVAVGEAVKIHKIGDRVFAPFSTNCGRCYFCKNSLPSRCEVGQLFGWVQDGNGLAGGQAEYVRVPFADGTLLQPPAGLSDVSALLLGDNFSTGYYCAEMAGIEPGGSYAVIGCGTVGLLCIVAAKSLGAEKIFALDPVAHRRQHAESLGAIGLDSSDGAVEEIRGKTDGRGVDAVMELVGIPAAQELAFKLVRPGGILSVIGCHCTPHFAFSPVDAYDKNLTYRTGRCPARHYMNLLTDKVASETFSIDQFVTHRFSAVDCVEAYDVFSNRKNGCLKAVFEF